MKALYFLLPSDIFPYKVQTWFGILSWYSDGLPCNFLNRMVCGWCSTLYLIMVIEEHYSLIWDTATCNAETSLILLYSHLIIQCHIMCTYS